MIQNELERMIENAIKNGVNRKFEKSHYMKLVIRAMSDGKRYSDLDEALTANAAAYDLLHISSSNAGMIAGEIRGTYFRGNMEDVLINGLARNDSQALAQFMNVRLAQLGAKS